MKGALVTLFAVLIALPWTAVRGERARDTTFRNSYLSNPESFDLGMDPNLFRGQSRWNRDLSTCHTQGLAVTEDTLLISCVLYDLRVKREGPYKAEALLLETPLQPILNRKPDKATWEVRNITTLAPRKEHLRIANGVFGKNLPPGAKGFTYPLGHPSGLFLDPSSQIVWFVTSVYGPNSLSRLYQYHTKTHSLEELPMNIPDHIGATALVLDRFLIGPTWGSESFLILDTLTGLLRLHPNRSGEKVDYQDCFYIDKTKFACGGFLRTSDEPTKKSVGKIHFLTVSGNDLKSLQIQWEGNAQIALGPGKLPTNEFGSREFIYLPGAGDVERGRNSYGNYESPLGLTNEGLALSPDRRYVYFLPEDLPQGRLIRYEWIPKK